jgi:ArsR family metal-binding transcriptional regulator
MNNNKKFLEKRKRQIILGIHDQLGRITINDIYNNKKIKEKFDSISKTLDCGKIVSIRKEAFNLFNDYINS